MLYGMREKDVVRFWRFAPRGEPTECWPWAGGIKRGGYGTFSISVDGRPFTLGAHRVAYELSVGAVPEGMHVCHHCDNPACVNPAHLFLGTHTDNMRDMIAKGRARRRTGPFPQSALANRARGEDSVASKLTEAAVLRIKALLLIGVSQTEIAEKHGVSKTCISQIARGDAWRHVVYDPARATR